MLKLSNLGSKSGKKTDSAAQWSIPTVNHTWLEDCFVNWRNLSVGHEKYVRFSPACDCSGFLGDRGMGRKVILDDARQGVPTQDLGAPTGSIREVEEAIAVDENDPGASSEHPGGGDEVRDVEMVNNDAPDTGVDMEVDAPPVREHTASPSPAPKKRRKSGDAKPKVTEGNNSRTPSRSAPTRGGTRSQVEVVVPTRPDHPPSEKRNTPTATKVKKPVSHKSMISESTVSAKKPSPVKVKTPARKSVPAVEEEEETVSVKRAPPKRTQKRKRDESESEEEHERLDKPTPGPSKPKPTQTTRATQRPPQEPSPSPALPDDAPSRGRRSAAQKADEKLRDIMPDVINFQKQMKRGTVVGHWEKAEKEQEKADKTKEKEKLKENAREKAKETAKRRRSDVRYGPPELISQPTRALPF